KTLMPVEFGDETVLVDFAGGEQRYDKTIGEGEAAKTEIVRDEAPIELLMMRPDGKVIAHNTLTDGKDEVRKEREEAFVDRIRALTGMSRRGGSGGKDDDILKRKPNP